MDIINAIKDIFANKQESRGLSKSMIMLLVAQYELDYVIHDRKSGIRLRDIDIQDFDTRYHTIWIEDEEKWVKMFANE